MVSSRRTFKVKLCGGLTLGQTFDGIASKRLGMRTWTPSQKDGELNWWALAGTDEFRTDTNLCGYAAPNAHARARSVTYCAPT